jgi:energy-coupling factor transport system permease protein
MDILRALPLGLYLEQPITWLHRLDPRVKLFWLMGFLLTPLLANSYWRIALVLLLILLTLLARIPLRVWRQQMGWLLTLSGLIFVMTAIAPDGLLAEHQPRDMPGLTLDGPAQVTPKPSPTNQASTPSSSLNTNEVETKSAPNPSEINKNASKNDRDQLKDNSQLDGGLAKFFPWTPKPSLDNGLEPSLPPASDYHYIIFQAGPFTLTRRTVDLGIRVSTLIFTLIYSTNLYLLTTAPEEITAGLEDLMLPLRYLKLPVTEIALTLTLALRYIPLVLEEIQNLGRSIWTRAIDWKTLGIKRSIRVWLTVAERLIENLLLRASQAANAMQVRGFTSPNRHRVQWHDLSLKARDWFAIAGLTVLCGLRLILGGDP